MLDPTRHDGDPDRIAIILPGVRYTPARPLLHFVRSVLAHHGWTIQEVWWEPPTELAEPQAWVERQVEVQIDRENVAPRLLVGKSVGSLALPLAADRGIAGVWLTPLLHRPSVREALARQRAETLLIGGSADPSWDAQAARTGGHRVVELPDADHALEVPDDPRGSVNHLMTVVGAVDLFLVALG